MNNLLLDFGVINSISKNKEELYNNYFLNTLNGLKENGDYAYNNDKKFTLGKIENEFFDFELENPYNNKINKMALHSLNQFTAVRVKRNNGLFHSRYATIMILQP